MKHRKFLTGKHLDNTKIPPCYRYFKYRDTTELESNRAVRKMRRNNCSKYKLLVEKVKLIKSNRKFSSAIKKALR